jgi:hypothetical protein
LSAFEKLDKLKNWGEISCAEREKNSIGVQDFRINLNGRETTE